jgi:ribokinase
MADERPAGHVTVLGSAHEDVFLSVARFPVPGETVLARRADRLFGGKGANQAISAARAGADVSFVGVVGEDEGGQRVLANLVGHGVDVTTVRRSVHAPTGLAVIVVDDSGDNQIVVASGAAEEIDDAFVDAALDGLRPGSVLVLQCELPAQAVARAIHHGARTGARTLVNLAPFVELPEDALRAASVIVLNEIEAMSLNGSADDGSPEALAAGIAQRTGVETILTLGSRGSVLAQPTREPIRVPALAVADVVDTTGAGDAFVGTLAASMAAGNITIEAMRMASTAAARIVEFRGAQPPHRTRADSATPA